MSVKYFLSGASGIRSEVLPDVAALIPHRLLSMHKAFKSNTRVWCEVSHHPKSGLQEVMLDSGAFTAFWNNEVLTLDSLIATYDDTIRKMNPDLQIWLINLDVIPGAPGRESSPQEIEQAIDASDQNFRKLRKRYGDRVLPVYHQTEGQKRLLDVARMADYIGFGFRQDFAEEHRISHAQEALEVVAPLGKQVHGLATTGYKMLARAPFDSVDSATWLYIAAMGGVMFLDDKGDVSNIAVSSSSPRQREIRAHFNTLDPDEQALIVKHAENAGTSLEQIQNDLSYRILYNAHQMREWLAHSYQRPNVVPEKGLFDL